MSNVSLYGFPISTYVRTVRIALAEKGIEHELFPFQPNTDEMRAINPTGKVPAFKHGDFVLYETLAIVNYIEEAFDGPTLMPSDIQQRAIMNQWISYVNACAFPVLIHEIALFRFEIKPMDEAVLEAAIPKAKEQFSLMEDTLSNSSYLAGDAPTLADYFLYPVLAFFGMIPEASLMADYPGLTAWLKRMEAIDSVKDSAPNF